MRYRTDDIIADLFELNPDIEKLVFEFEEKYNCNLKYNITKINSISNTLYEYEIYFKNNYVLYIDVDNDYVINLEWVYNNHTHAIDEPAIINKDGEYWYLHGKLHRINGPAIIRNNGDEEWWILGKRHRSDGKPAIYYSCGYEEWWENGVNVTKKYKRLEKIDKLLNN